MRRTLPATDARRYPDSYTSERPFEALASIPITLALLFLVPALAFLAPRAQRDAVARWPGLPRAVLLVAILAWVVLFLAGAILLGIASSCASVESPLRSLERRHDAVTH